MRAEFNAFKARAEAHTIITGKTDTTVRVTKSGDAVRENYVVLWPAAPDRLNDDRFNLVPTSASDRLLTFDTRPVAVDADGVLMFAEALLAQLVGHELTVTGRACSPIRLVEGVEEGRVEYDRSSRLYYLDMSFRFWSRRAEPEEPSPPGEG